MGEKQQLFFWAKTIPGERPGISVHDHCLNVGCVAEAILATLPANVRSLLPPGSATLAALHDVGKITVGFQAKCVAWRSALASQNLEYSDALIALSVTDHARVSQYFLENLDVFKSARLWAVAVGAHHGRPKGKRIKLEPGEFALPEWAEANRLALMRELITEFGALPKEPPQTELRNSDLWFLAGLITVADWIGSNEKWFSPKEGSLPAAARQKAAAALHQIGWPGGKLKLTEFSAAFAARPGTSFDPNPLQQSLAEAAHAPGVIVVEGPMGCGKTEAALFAAQQLIATGHQHGIYFALPTQVTSNRIHERIGRFLWATLADAASLRLAHGNAWLEDGFDLHINPAFPNGKEKDGEQPNETAREARSWFASAKQALLATYGVGTVDQALQGVVAVKHFFVRRFALAGKVVILDEVHSYDIYTGTLITALIRELVNLRCTVIILSATLTADRRKELLEAAGIREAVSPPDYPLVSFGEAGGECRHLKPAWPVQKRISLRPAVISDTETIGELTRRAEAGQHVLWIRNTVVEAQQAYRAAVSAICQDTVRVGLLHSRFPFARRAKLESDWLEHLGPNRPPVGPGSILIATQVVEQSVDIDLDFIVSDLAPTDMLLQRMGRLWRHPRPHRQAAAPEFWIRLPDLSAAENTAALKAALGRSGWVYAPYVLLRTAAVWQSKSEINLPTDIRPLLDATYDDPEQQEPETWHELHVELEGEKRKLMLVATSATNVFNTPMLEDREEILTRAKGAPTTPVILLRSITTTGNNSVRVVALDGSQTEISAFDWQRSAAKFLQQWLVRTPRWLVPAEAPHPPWLTLHAPNHATVATVADDGRCYFADQISNMTYHSCLGLFAERSIRTTTPPKDYDEFDY